MDSGNLRSGIFLEEIGVIQEDLKILKENQHAEKLTRVTRRCFNIRTASTYMQSGEVKNENDYIKDFPYKPAEGHKYSGYPVFIRDSLRRMNVAVYDVYARPPLRPALKEVDIQNYSNKMGVQPSSGRFRRLTVGHTFVANEGIKKNYTIEDLLHSECFQGGFQHAPSSLKSAAVGHMFEDVKNQQNHAGESPLHSGNFQGASSGVRNSPFIQNSSDEVKVQRNGIYPFAYDNRRNDIWEASIKLTKLDKLQKDRMAGKILELNVSARRLGYRIADEYGGTYVRKPNRCHCDVCCHHPRFKDYVILHENMESTLISSIEIALQKEECTKYNNLASANKFSNKRQKHEKEFNNRNTHYLFFVQRAPFGVTRPNETGTENLFNQRTHISPEFVKPKEQQFECKKENWKWDGNAYMQCKPQPEENSKNPDSPPACVICLSNPSKNDLYCADCINSIEV